MVVGSGKQHDKSFVVHLLKPAINQCLKGALFMFAVQYILGLSPSSDISNPSDAINM